MTTKKTKKTENPLAPKTLDLEKSVKAAKALRREKTLHQIQEAGPLGLNRSRVEGFVGNVEEAASFIRDFIDDGDVTEKNPGGESPWYVATDQTRYKEWERQDAGGESAEVRRANRRAARTAEAQRAAPEPASKPAKARSPKPAAKAPESGSWSVTRTQKGSAGTVLIGTFPDKRLARAAARKAVLLDLTVYILDGDGNVTNTYA